jgi:hypothetical protein
MKTDYVIGDLVHIPQAVELLDCTSDGAQINIPLRLHRTKSPKIGVVAESSRDWEDYISVYCDGEVWTVSARSVYSVGEK